MTSSECHMHARLHARAAASLHAGVAIVIVAIPCITVEHATTEWVFRKFEVRPGVPGRGWDRARVEWSGVEWSGPTACVRAQRCPV